MWYNASIVKNFRMAIGYGKFSSPPESFKGFFTYRNLLIDVHNQRGNMT